MEEIDDALFQAELDTVFEPYPENALLVALRRLPTVWPFQPVQWIPRHLRQLASNILASLLADATTSAVKPTPSDEDEITQLLLRASAGLLFRPAQTSDETSGTTVAAIRTRLHQAREGDWFALVTDCLRDIELFRTHGQNPAPVATPGELDTRQLHAAAFKARHGSLRAATDILIGNPQVPAGHETDEKIRALYRTEPLSDHEKSRLADAISAVDALPVRTRLTIKPRTASRQCALLKPAAGPGPSGFRNSFIQCIHSNAQGPRFLAAWASVWGRGEIKPWAAGLWTHTLARSSD